MGTRSRTSRRRDGPGLRPFDDLVDLVGLEAVCFSVDAGRGLGVGGLDEAEDLAVSLADPVALVALSMVSLNGDVLRVGIANGVAGNPPVHVVYVHVERHEQP